MRLQVAIVWVLSDPANKRSMGIICGVGQPVLEFHKEFNATIRSMGGTSQWLTSQAKGAYSAHIADNLGRCRDQDSLQNAGFILDARGASQAAEPDLQMEDEFCEHFLGARARVRSCSCSSS